MLKTSCTRRGATLIEVLAGLVVLSTLLASLAIARGRFMRQWADADRKVAVAGAADRLLATWMDSPPQGVVIPAEGRFDKIDRVIWRARWLSDQSAAPLAGGIVRLDVVDQRDNRDDRTLLSIDFVLHKVPKVAATQAVRRQ